MPGSASASAAASAGKARGKKKNTGGGKEEETTAGAAKAPSFAVNFAGALEWQRRKAPKEALGESAMTRAVLHQRHPYFPYVAGCEYEVEPAPGCITGRGDIAWQSAPLRPLGGAIVAEDEEKEGAMPVAHVLVMELKVVSGDFSRDAKGSSQADQMQQAWKLARPTATVVHSLTATEEELRWWEHPSIARVSCSAGRGSLAIPLIPDMTPISAFLSPSSPKPRISSVQWRSLLIKQTQRQRGCCARCRVREQEDVEGNPYPPSSAAAAAATAGAAAAGGAGDGAAAAAEAATQTGWSEAQLDHSGGLLLHPLWVVDSNHADGTSPGDEVKRDVRTELKHVETHLKPLARSALAAAAAAAAGEDDDNAEDLDDPEDAAACSALAAARGAAKKKEQKKMALRERQERIAAEGAPVNRQYHDNALAWGGANVDPAEARGEGASDRRQGRERKMEARQQRAARPPAWGRGGGNQPPRGSHTRAMISRSYESGPSLRLCGFEALCASCMAVVHFRGSDEDQTGQVVAQMMRANRGWDEATCRAEIRRAHEKRDCEVEWSGGHWKLDFQSFPPDQWAAGGDARAFLPKLCCQEDVVEWVQKAEGGK